MVLMFALLLMVLAGCTADQNPIEKTPDPPANGAITGTIINGMDRPLAGATVTADPGGLTGSTDSAGHYYISGLVAGIYSLTVRKEGFSSSNDFLVHAGDTTQANIRLPIWRLLWQDEFDGTGLDTTRWEPKQGRVGLPNELFWCAADEVIVDSGHLTLRTRKHDSSGYPYTTGQIASKDTMLFGRFEVRARLPRGKGIWPAHWLWPGDNVRMPEIDIMEMLGNAPGIIHMTHHYLDLNGVPQQSALTYSGPNYSEDYHVFAVDWYPSEIRWFIDGVERFRTPTVGHQNPMILILDTYVGGSWPGNPDSTTVFPQYHDIDYVRIYESQ